MCVSFNLLCGPVFYIHFTFLHVCDNTSNTRTLSFDVASWRLMHTQVYECGTTRATTAIDIINLFTIRIEHAPCELNRFFAQIKWFCRSNIACNSYRTKYRISFIFHLFRLASMSDGYLLKVLRLMVWEAVSIFEVAACPPHSARRSIQNTATLKLKTVMQSNNFYALNAIAFIVLAKRSAALNCTL